VRKSINITKGLALNQKARGHEEHKQHFSSLLEKYEKAHSLTRTLLQRRPGMSEAAARAELQAGVRAMMRKHLKAMRKNHCKTNLGNYRNNRRKWLRELSDCSDITNNRRRTGGSPVSFSPRDVKEIMRLDRAELAVNINPNRKEAANASRLAAFKTKLMTALVTDKLVKGMVSQIQSDEPKFPALMLYTPLLTEESRMHKAFLKSLRAVPDILSDGEWKGRRDRDRPVC